MSIPALPRLHAVATTRHNTHLRVVGSVETINRGVAEQTATALLVLLIGDATSERLGVLPFPPACNGAGPVGFNTHGEVGRHD